MVNSGSVLDLVLEHSRSLKNRLGRHDQQKMAEYLASVREVEQRVERSQRWLDIPKPEVAEDAVNVEVSQDAPREYIQSMYDLMFLALQTDSTRVVTYRQPVCSVLQGMGVALKAHSLSHYGFSQPRTLASRERDKKCSELFGHFLDRLKAA